MIRQVARYLRKVLQTHKSLRGLFPTARELLVARGIGSVAVPSGSAVLVIGSGDDPYSEVCVNPSLYACIDLVPRFRRTHAVANAETLPFRSNQFGVAIGTELLEHCKDPAAVVREVHRCLAPGGVAVFTVPFMFHVHADPHDFTRFTPEGLGVLFHEFEMCDVLPQGGRVHVISDLITTAWSPLPVFLPLRVFNHALLFLPKWLQAHSTAPSGFMITARK